MTGASTEESAIGSETKDHLYNAMRCAEADGDHELATQLHEMLDPTQNDQDDTPTEGRRRRKRRGSWLREGRQTGRPKNAADQARRFLLGR